MLTEYAMLRCESPSIRSVRPPQVLETAERVSRWAQRSEACERCRSADAERLLWGMAVCSACRGQVAAFDVGRAPLPEVRGADDLAALEGLAIVFDSLSVDLGGFREVIRPAAIDRTISEGIDVRALWSHNPDLTLGRQSAGTLQIAKTRRGVRASIDPPGWAEPQIESVRRRDVTGMSFGFIALTDDWHLEDGDPIREVLDMRVTEVSGVSFPAYPDTTLRAVAPSSRALDRDRSARLRLAAV